MSFKHKMQDLHWPAAHRYHPEETRCTHDRDCWEPSSTEGGTGQTFACTQHEHISSATTGCWSPFCFCHCPTIKKQAQWISWKDLLKQLPYSEAADQTCYLIKSCCADTRLTSPSAEPVMPGIWEGRHQDTNFSVPGKNELWICGKTLGM